MAEAGAKVVMLMDVMTLLAVEEEAEVVPADLVVADLVVVAQVAHVKDGLSIVVIK